MKITNKNQINLANFNKFGVLLTYSVKARPSRLMTGTRTYAFKVVGGYMKRTFDLNTHTVDGMTFETEELKHESQVFSNLADLKYAVTVNHF